MTDAGPIDLLGISETAAEARSHSMCGIDSGADQQMGLGRGARRPAQRHYVFEGYVDRKKDREALPKLRAPDREH